MIMSCLQSASRANKCSSFVLCAWITELLRNWRNAGTAVRSRIYLQGTQKYIEQADRLGVYSISVRPGAFYVTIHSISVSEHKKERQL